MNEMYTFVPIKEEKNNNIVNEVEEVLEENSLDNVQVVETIDDNSLDKNQVMEKSIQEEDSKKRICPNCGLASTGNFCTQCGFMLED